MATLQSNLEYLSSRINDTLDNKKAEQNLISDRKNAQHISESKELTAQISDKNEHPISEMEEQPYTEDYNESTNVQGFENENEKYARENDNVDQIDAPNSRVDDQQNYVSETEQKYEGQEYPVEQNYPTEYANQDYDQYGQYGQYQGNPSGEEINQHATADHVTYEPDQQQYENYSSEHYLDDKPHIPDA